MAKYETIMKVLALIGGIIALTIAISGFFGEAILGLFGWAVSSFWGIAIVWQIITIILAIIVILSVIKPNQPIPFTAIFLLIVGILIIIFGSLIAGILVLVAGILGFIK